MAALAPCLNVMAWSQAQVDAQAPRQLVTLRSGVLTIDADSVRLSEILEAIRLKTGAEIEVLPGMTEKYVSHLEGEPRAVIAELLSGCGFGYVIMGSSEDPNRISRIVFSSLGGSAGTTSRGEAAKASAAVAETPARNVFLPRSLERGHPSETAPVDTSMRVPGAESAPEGDGSTSGIVVGGIAIPAAATQENSGGAAGISVTATAAVAGPDSAVAADASAAPVDPKKTADQGENKIGPAGQMLQEMYKARQQLQPATTPY